MNEYSEECLNTFLKEQKKLFDEPVAENMEEAEAFLADCDLIFHIMPNLSDFLLMLLDLFVMKLLIFIFF